jgi:hypothetical protein
VTEPHTPTAASGLKDSTLGPEVKVSVPKGESFFLPQGPAPMVTPDGSYQLTARRPGRELFPSSWLRHRARIHYGDGEDLLEGVLLEFCSTGLIVQANGHKTLVNWDAWRTIELLEEYEK